MNIVDRKFKKPPLQGSIFPAKATKFGGSPQAGLPALHT